MNAKEDDLGVKYKIIISGQVEESWICDMDLMHIKLCSYNALEAQITLILHLVDQAQLCSILNRFFDLGCTLLLMARLSSQRK